MEQIGKCSEIYSYIFIRLQQPDCSFVWDPWGAFVCRMEMSGFFAETPTSAFLADS